MARFSFLTLLAWASLSGVCSFRTGFRTVTSHAAHAGRGLNFTVRAQSGPAPPLKLFASTYNAYNRRYEQASAADDMLLPLVQGHEEADIVILGLQEFSDKVTRGQYIFEHVRKDFLWSAQFDLQVQQLKDIASRPAPENVVKARDAIVQKFDVFHDRLNTELTALQHFAQNDNTFRAAIESHSPAAKLLGNSTAHIVYPTRSGDDVTQVHATEAVKHTIGKLLDSYEENKETAAKHQFGDLRVKLEAIKSIANEFNNQDYEAHFTEIENWKRALNQEFFEFHSKNQNFELTGPGREQYQQLVDGFKEAPIRARESIQSGSHLNAIKEQLDAFQGEVEQKAMEESESAVTNAIGRWNKVLEDVKQLETDMTAMKQDGAVLANIVSEVTSKISHESRQLQDSLGTWKAKVREHVQTVGDLAHKKFHITNAMLEIPVVAETFHSDSRRSVCHTASHYDTELRVFAKPWSLWKLNKDKTVKYSIDYNGKSEKFGLVGQCGKGVNVVRVTLEDRTGHEVNLCVLNAHQSFKFPFQHRLENLADTLASLEGGKGFNDWQSAPHNVRWQTEDLKCHATVYTADFNTRLMCQIPGESIENPLIDSGGSQSSFMNVVSTFCSGDSCELGSSEKAQADELTQFLTQEKISCFEEESKKKKWTLRSDVLNPLFAAKFAKHRLREVDVPKFAPTYKLGDKKATEGKGKKKEPMSEWSKCLANDKLCLVNQDQDAKHNPAWTDRILVRDSDVVTVSSDKYERRTFTSVQCGVPTEAESCSDHAIVSSMMSLTVQEAAL